MASMLMLFAVFIILLFACIGVDIAHFVSANIELQNVADAAAYAGVMELAWNVPGGDPRITAAQNAARTMAQRSYADIYGPGLNIPSGSINPQVISLNGGTNNAIRVTVNPPMAFLFAPFMIGNAGGSLVGASATAEQLPILTVPSPPWFLDPGCQGGPVVPNPPLPVAAPPPPTTFPTNAYVTFVDCSKLGPSPGPKLAPTKLPCYWVDYGLSNASTYKSNPVGVAKAIQCMGICKTGDPTCDGVNPITAGVSIINSNHGALNSAKSSPDDRSADWTGQQHTILPIATDGGVVTGFYSVILTGPYEPGTYNNGQGVFGEFGITFLGSANGIPGVIVSDPTSGSVLTPMGSTLAQLVK
ncbi:MAG TPA: pilus assembly protein TadG-related protein [Candidatus Obscuribacterales bacterium]